MAVVATYIQAFCRIVILLVFFTSVTDKIRHIKTFQDTITNFALVSKPRSRLIAPVIVFAEAAIVVCMLVGGFFLFPGFLLATGLLALFCLAMCSVLVRKITTTCSCFGPTTRPISLSDIIRNIGLIIYAQGGCWPLPNAGQNQERLNFIEWVLIGLSALVFALFWMQLSEIIQLFHQADA